MQSVLIEVFTYLFPTPTALEFSTNRFAIIYFQLVNLNSISFWKNSRISEITLTHKFKILPSILHIVDSIPNLLRCET